MMKKSEEAMVKAAHATTKDQAEAIWEALDRLIKLYEEEGEGDEDRTLLEAAKQVQARIADAYASGAGATLLCDPMVDPRGGAYTVGLGMITLPAEAAATAAVPFDADPAPAGPHDHFDLVTDRGLLRLTDRKSVV